ncbi:MAG: hypothetical protein OXI57_02810 [Rhodospirillales bacterium]|nr:hypothetical protein [Rhodospirillales bacterium]
MMDVATFLQSMDRARGSRSDKEISQAAGLSGNAVAAMRAGKVPSLERAARVADVVDLELCLRRKGESISPWALRLTFEVFLRHFRKGGGGSPITEDEIAARAEGMAKYVAQIYGPLATMFDPSECDEPEEQFRLAQVYGQFLKSAEDKDMALFATAAWDLATGTTKDVRDERNRATPNSGDAEQPADATTGTDDEPAT